MQIERIEEARLTAADEAEIATLLEAAFRVGFGGRSYYQQRHHVRMVHRRAGRIVGHVALDLRAIRIADRLVACAGLGDVATDPAHRKQGIASALLDAAIAEARAMRAEFFILFGDAPLYAAAGFQPMTNPLCYSSFIDVRTGAVVRDRKEGLMVLPLTGAQWDPEAEVDLVGHAF